MRIRNPEGSFGKTILTPDFDIAGQRSPLIPRPSVRNRDCTMEFQRKRESFQRRSDGSKCTPNDSLGERFSRRPLCQTDSWRETLKTDLTVCVKGDLISRTWRGNHMNFHGACDLVFIQSKDFGSQASKFDGTFVRICEVICPLISSSSSVAHQSRVSSLPPHNAGATQLNFLIRLRTPSPHLSLLMRLRCVLEGAGKQRQTHMISACLD
jgi:hypothetical protein